MATSKIERARGIIVTDAFVSDNVNVTIDKQAGLEVDGNNAANAIANGLVIFTVSDEIPKYTTVIKLDTDKYNWLDMNYSIKDNHDNSYQHHSNKNTGIQSASVISAGTYTIVIPY